MIQSHQSLHQQLSILFNMILFAGLAIFVRLFQLQVYQNVEYSELARQNSTQMIYQSAPRGRVYDRNGVLVATNEGAFSLIYLPPKAKEKVDLKPLADALSKQLGQDPDNLLETLQEAVREQSALRLAENLPRQTYFRLKELKTIYPGIDLIEEARRYYPFGRFASHLLGYMGKMDPRSWKHLKTQGYRVDSRIGRLGIEGKFEKELRGRDGGIRMVVDAQGRLKRKLGSFKWETGSNLYLTIDAAVQKAADEGLRKTATGRGAAVALDPRSGAVLALSSAPDFDPNLLLSSDPEVVKSVVAGLPEFNHAISGVYPPGSAFKVIVSAAGLNENRINPEDTVFCPGYFELGKNIFLCWNHKGHKRVNWWTGLAQSCDVFFYRTGLKIGGSLIEKYARTFGLGQKTNIFLNGERSGHLFGPQTRQDAGRGWYDGDSVNLAIGQGELLVTPIQMAVMAAAIANRGSLWRPYYVEHIDLPEGRQEFGKPEKLGSVVLKDYVWKELQDGMALVVSSGTGVPAQIRGLDVRGKTGTAQNSGGDDHAWFVSYAERPGEQPAVAVAVLVENGGHGASVAAPIARSMIMAAYRLEDRGGKIVPSTSTFSAPLPASRGKTALGLPMRTL
ncbi:MAG: penicillin-binding protein 2 [Elusimicrobia bacterium]|nr:penicillin-binding protein 2 [Elusimicrobiota bacterium]